MSGEESIIYSIKPIINARKTHIDNQLYSLRLNAYQLDCIEGLLDLYNKQKSAKETLGNVVLKLTEENKKLKKSYEATLKELNKYWVSKDKIKENIKYIENKLNDIKTNDGKEIMKAVINILQDLLEEE